MSDNPPDFYCYYCAEPRNYSELAPGALAYELFKDSKYYNVRPFHKFCKTCVRRRERKLHNLTSSQPVSLPSTDFSQLDYSDTSVVSTNVTSKAGPKSAKERWELERRTSTESQGINRSIQSCSSETNADGCDTSVVRNNVTSKAGPKSVKERWELERRASPELQGNNRSNQSYSSAASDDSDEPMFVVPKAGPKSVKERWLKQARQQTNNEPQDSRLGPESFTVDDDNSLSGYQLNQDSFDRLVNRPPPLTSTQQTASFSNQVEAMEYDVPRTADPDQRSESQNHSSENVPLSQVSQGQFEQPAFSDEMYAASQPQSGSNNSEEISSRSDLTLPPAGWVPEPNRRSSDFSDIGEESNIEQSAEDQRIYSVLTRSRSRSPSTDGSAISSIAPMQVPRIRTQRTRLLRPNLTPRVNGG